MKYLLSLSYKRSITLCLLSLSTISAKTITDSDQNKLIYNDKRYIAAIDLTNNQNLGLKNTVGEGLRSKYAEDKNLEEKLKSTIKNNENTNNIHMKVELDDKDRGNLNYKDYINSDKIIPHSSTNNENFINDINTTSIMNLNEPNQQNPPFFENYDYYSENRGPRVNLNPQINTIEHKARKNNATFSKLKKSISVKAGALLIMTTMIAFGFLYSRLRVEVPVEEFAMDDTVLKIEVNGRQCESSVSDIRGVGKSTSSTSTPRNTDSIVSQESTEVETDMFLQAASKNIGRVF